MKMANKPTIAMFLHQPKCSIQSTNGVMHSLESNYRFKIFTKHEVEDNFFDDVDVVCFPGGLGDSDSWDYLMPQNIEAINRFVKQGGKYLGICMGAYWAGKHYFNFLENCHAVQYIRRPGTDTRRPHAKAQSIMWQGQHTKMFFYDGCSLVGPGIANSEVWATYPNGDAMALIQNNIGVIGCHPESEQFWYNEYSYMKRHWHYGQHHTLLLNFVDRLLK